jgi:hypothetical protein
LKLLVVLRDPIERAFSYYSMIQEHDDREFCFGDSKSNLTFDQHIAREVDELNRLGLSSAPAVSEFSSSSSSSSSSNNMTDNQLFAQPNMTSTRLRRTLENNIRASTKIGSTRLCGLYWNSLYMGMYAMQLREWIQYYPLGSHLKVIRSEALKDDTKKVYGDVVKFIGLSSEEMDDRAFSKNWSPQNMGLFNSTKQEITPASAQTLEYLRNFYKPYNDELADLLGEEWRDVWVKP